MLWRRSPRARRVSLRIDTRAAAVVVTLPMRAARAAGIRLLNEHAAWVSAQLAALPPAMAFADGGVIPLGGDPHPIRHVAGDRNEARLAGAEIHVAGDPQHIPCLVTALLRAEAGRRLGALVQQVSGETGLRATQLTIRDTSSRWGSCSAAGTVMFNWRLVMAPSAVQHYAVVHEMAHLRHMNHGPQFWALVSELAPGMAGSIAWLEQHGAMLMRAGAAVAAVSRT